MTDNTQQFASDNYSGIRPEAWAAMAEANRGHERAYGDDQWTARASDYFRQLFETDCEVFFAFNGTAANSAVPELPQRDLLGDRPRRDRRVRRAGVLLQRLQAAAGADRGRQADPGVDPRHRSQAPGYPLSEAARGDSHPGHRGRHGVPPGRVEGDQRHLQGTRPAPAHGRRALPTPAPSSAARRRS